MSKELKTSLEKVKEKLTIAEKALNEIAFVNSVEEPNEIAKSALDKISKCDGF
jgi:hypothetical protein